MNRDIWQKYQLGYVASPLPGDERFSGMLSIPYLTQAGVKGMKYRRVAGEGAKYAQPEGQTPRLYNPAAHFTAHTEIGLAEGELDAIVATELLGVPTMGIPGAEMWQANSKTWAPIFKDFSRVLVFADGDKIDSKTGKRAGEELAKLIAETVGWRAQIIWCPEGEDVSSLVAAGNTAMLVSQINARKDDE